jgi:hypothetical protein
MNDQVISNEEDLQKLRDSWDQEKKIFLEQLVTRERNHRQNVMEFHQEYVKFRAEWSQEIENLADQCRQDVTTVLDANQELSTDLQELTAKYYECQRNRPTPRLASGISQLTRFQEGLNQIFGWSVSFIIWPLALHDPDSDLWKLLAQTSGVKLRRSPDNSWFDMPADGRGSDCVMVVVFVDSGQKIVMG